LTIIKKKYDAASRNGNEKSLVRQKTNEKSKARKNKLIVANQLLLKDNYVSNVYKTKGALYSWLQKKRELSE
jgi:hypothetical protein